MNPSELYLLISSNYGQFFLELLIVSLVFFVIFRKSIVGIFDPLFFVVLPLVICFTVNLFMLTVNVIKFEVFLYYFFCMSLFIIGFLVNVRKTIDYRIKKRVANSSSVNETLLIKYTFFVSLVFFVAAVLVDYSIGGIPLFLSSRLGTYSDNAGFGIVKRFVYISTVILLVCSFYLYYNEVRNKLAYKFVAFISMSFVLISMVLSGAKSGFIQFIFILFFMKFFIKIPVNRVLLDKFSVNLKEISIFISLILLAVFLVYVRSGGSIVQSLLYIVNRVVNYADIYIMLFPNDMVSSITNDNWFFALFGNFLRVFRIVDTSNVPELLGVQLYDLFYPGLGHLAGANARYISLAYVYLGYFGFPFSFVIGFFVGYCRFKLYKKMPSTVWGLIFYILITFIAYTCVTDFIYGLDILASVIIVTPIVFLISHVLLYIQNKSSYVSG